MSAALRRADVARLLAACRAARERAYAPYSHYRVGAALLTRSGRLHQGCNVENASYGATVCAERAAVAAMIGAGDSEPIACAIVTAGPIPATPCGICRQVLSEFARDMPIVCFAEDADGHVVGRRATRLSTLFPGAFRLDAATATATQSGVRRARTIAKKSDTRARGRR